MLTTRTAQVVDAISSTSLIVTLILVAGKMNHLPIRLMLSLPQQRYRRADAASDLFLLSHCIRASPTSTLVSTTLTRAVALRLATAVIASNTGSLLVELFGG